jgi:hypothetical protein
MNNNGVILRGVGDYLHVTDDQWRTIVFESSLQTVKVINTIHLCILTLLPEIGTFPYFFPHIQQQNTGFSNV